MKKRKNIAVSVALAAAMTTLSVPGNIQDVKASSYTYEVSVAQGYLALRNSMAYDSSNEIGELYSGDLVEVQDFTSKDYWYVYSPKYDCWGYVNSDYLISLYSQNYRFPSDSWTVSVSKGYLALRNAKAYDSSNEIGQLNNGDSVWLSDSSDPTYWYVYSPKLNCYGYVNKDYLYYNGTTRSAKAIDYYGEMRTVSVATGYLALRTQKAYDVSNEIGELYSGDTVQLLDTTDSQYWYVYSPKYDMNGFVNKDYLIGSTTYTTRTVSVATGYLALRNAKSYDVSNEIGELYSGDTVQLIDANDTQYWYVYSPKLNRYGYVNKDYLY